MNPARRARRRLLTVPVDAARRKFLIAFGVAYVLIGISFALAESTANVRMALDWTHIPFTLFGLIWASCGITAFVASFVPTTRDKPGFLMLSIPPTLWAFLYAGTYVLTLVTDYEAPRAWVSLVIFALIAYAVDVVSGMVDARLVANDEGDGL